MKKMKVALVMVSLVCALSVGYVFGQGRETRTPAQREFSDIKDRFERQGGANELSALVAAYAKAPSKPENAYWIVHLSMFGDRGYDTDSLLVLQTMQNQKIIEQNQKIIELLGKQKSGK